MSIQTHIVRSIAGVAGGFITLTGLLITLYRGLDSFLLTMIHDLIGEAPSIFWSDKLIWLGLEALLFGGLILILLGMHIFRREKLEAVVRHRRFFPITAILLLVLLWTPIVLFGHHFSFDGERYWYLGDDAMISMRYAQNLANGHGLVWNPGERVEGYTNFLWTLYMAGVHAVGVPISKTSLVILLTNILLSIAVIPVLIKLVGQLGGDKLAVAGTLLGYILCNNLMFWTTSGFETALLTWLFLLALSRIIEDARTDRLRLTTFLIVTVIALVRADAIIISGLCYLLAFIIHRQRLLLLGYVGLTLLLLVAHEVFRLVYYGDLLPNTAYLKVTHWEDKYTAGFKYLFGFVRSYALPILFAILGTLATRKIMPRLLIGLIASYAAYVIWVGGDVFTDYRFFVPFIPLLFALTFTGLQDLGQKREMRVLLTTLCIVTAPLIVPGYAAHLIPRPSDLGNVEIGLLLKNNTPADARVADFWAGSVFYFSERYAIDLLGKSDPHIAQLPALADGMMPGHNKFDFDYSLGKFKPDYVVANFKLPVDEAKMRRDASGSFAFTGQLFYNPLFQKYYLDNPLNDETWRTIFAFSETR